MKILYVATVVKTHIMEFHIPYLKMLKKMGWKTSVAAKNDYDNPSECIIPYCDKYYDIPFERNPLNGGNIKAYKKLKKIIDSEEYDIIHCHTPVGAMLTRLAATDAREKGTRVIYTAHGFHFYKGAPIVNWLLYYPAERLLARKTDVLITITKEDYKRARKFKAGKVEYVPGIGIDIKRFKKGNTERAIELRKELGIPEKTKVILSVGEVNKNKNHKVVIEALSSFSDVWFVLCGRGPLIEKNRRLAEKLKVSEHVIMTGYRNDVVDFYNMADVFVIPSIREGLPVSLMEAMASELVCVAARNRGSNELLKGSELLFDPYNVDELKIKLKMALDADCTKEINRNKERLLNYGLDKTLKRVKEIYQREIKNPVYMGEGYE